MCGIFGQCSVRSPAQCFENIVRGLEALQYRGYDSCGCAWLEQRGDGGMMRGVHAIGSVDALRQEMFARFSATLDAYQPLSKSWCVIAHTRWATHGKVSLVNTHPQIVDGRYALVHNGVVDNADQLRKTLVEQYHVDLRSETDSELIAQLIALEPIANPLTERVRAAVAQVHGANAIALISVHDPDCVLLWRRGSPLIVGLPQGSKEPRYFSQSATDFYEPSANDDSAHTCFTFASDVAALQGHAERALMLDDNEIALLNARAQTCTVLYPGKRSHCTIQPIGADDCENVIASIHNDHNDGLCMWREIHEQPRALRRAMAGRISGSDDGPNQSLTLLLGGLDKHWHEIQTASRLVMIACGTSYYAALAARPIFERYCGRQVVVERATPLLDRCMPVFRGDACFFLSQSGETADTLAALRHCKQRGALCIGIVNTVASSIARLTDCGLYLKCGPEIGVASTKAYTAQICVLAMIAARMTTNTNDCQLILRALLRIPTAIEKTLRLSSKWAPSLAKRWRTKEHCLLLARGSDEATCYEAALKIKELCYVLADGCHAGELKHGPLALVDSNLAIVAFGGDGDAQSSNVACKMAVSIEQVRARSGQPVVIRSSSNDNDGSASTHDVLLPSIGNELLQCVVNIVPLQLLAFHWAVARGHNVDRPRNLAKSVTVQ